MNSPETHKSETDIRIDKCGEIRKSGMLPYAERFERTHQPGEIASLPEGTAEISITGRIISIREFGKLTFIRLFDESGSVQVAFQKNDIGEGLELFGRLADTGDFIGVKGNVFITRTGEKSINAFHWTMLSKAIRPLPEKFHGLSDDESRLRKRYLDLITSQETMQRFRTRSNIIKTIRAHFENNGFTEIDTPVLTNQASGAMAKPFFTHHNALDIDIFLRIAPETYLKRAIAGGFDRVYEFARCFRNEGIDPSHLPDFTLLEYYASYWNYEDNMDFTENLIKQILQSVKGSLSIAYCGKEISFDCRWPRITFRDLILKDCGIDIFRITSAEELLSEITGKGITLYIGKDAEKAGLGSLFDLLYKKVSRPLISDPVFVTQHPVELSPLARRNDTDKRVTDRFQLVVNGWEIVNAYSELVDPVEQSERFSEQISARNKGDNETMEFDQDFLTAMEYGMPPMSGAGIGIDRLVALFTNSETLKDVVMFPLMRPE